MCTGRGSVVFGWERHGVCRVGVQFRLGEIPLRPGVAVRAQRNRVRIHALAAAVNLKGGVVAVKLFPKHGNCLAE